MVGAAQLESAGNRSGSVTSPAQPAQPAALAELTQLCAHSLACPVATVLGTDMTICAAVGLTQAECSTFARFLCWAAWQDPCRSGEPLFVEDMLRAGHAQVHQQLSLLLRIRAYAVVLLRSASGHALGLLCVANSQAHSFDSQARHTFVSSAKLAAGILEQQAVCRQHTAQLAELQAANRCLQQQAMANAEAVAAARTEFLANMSHEIKTPLNAVMACTQLLTDDSNHKMTLPPEQRELMGVIDNASRQLMMHVDDMLEFCDFNTHKVALERAPFDLWRCIDQVIETTSLQCASKGLDMYYALDPDVPTLLCGDEMRLAQVLTNVIGNAVKATERGAVDMLVRRAPSTLSVRESSTCASASSGEPPATGEALLFSVSTGETGLSSSTEAQRGQTGLAPGVRPTKRGSGGASFDGMGLGLSISKRIAREMGGNIHIQPPDEHGCTVFQVLVRQELTDVAVSHKPLAGKQVLVVSTCNHFHCMASCQLTSLGSRGHHIGTVAELHSMGDAGGGPAPAAQQCNAVVIDTEHLPGMEQDSAEDAAQQLQSMIDAVWRLGLPVVLGQVSREYYMTEVGRGPAPATSASSVISSACVALPQPVRRLCKPLTRHRLLEVLQSALQLKPAAEAMSPPTASPSAPSPKGQKPARMFASPPPPGSLPSRVRQRASQLSATSQNATLLGDASGCVPMDDGSSDAFMERSASCSSHTARPHPGPHPQAQASSRPQAAGAGLRILVADDNLVNQKVLGKLLQTLGYRADVASDGCEVLQALTRKRYDVILMDIRMPQMDGLEATRRIGQLAPELQPRWIFAVTADMLRSVEGACKSAGMAGYLCKPVSRDKLAAVLRACAQAALNDAAELDNVKLWGKGP